MGARAVGEVVLIVLPYSDLSNRKVRPGLVVGVAERDEAIVCQITSRPYTSAGAMDIWNASAMPGQTSCSRQAQRSSSASWVLSQRKTVIVRAAVGALFV